MVLHLNNEEAAQLLDMRSCLEVLEEAFKDLALGSALATNRRDLYSPAGEGTFYRLTTMEGIVERLGVCAQRIDSERITWRRIGGVMRQVELPVAPGDKFVGLIYLYSLKDCRLLAILNDSEIQRRRVAGVCALAAKHLARRDAEVMGLYGSGWQAEVQVEAMREVRPLRRVKVYSPNREHRRSFAERLSRSLGLEVEAVEDPREAAKGADLIAAATNAREPVCLSSWVREGAHLSCIGGADFDEPCWERSSVIYLAWRGLHEKHLMEDPKRRPDLSYDHMYGQGGRDAPLYSRFSHKIHYLPHLLVGRSPGRRSYYDVTLFQKTGSTQGIEFAATAKLVYERALKRGMGREMPDDWFLQSTPQ